MQSSVGLAFRALVMLGCLALVPLLAIYGKQLPDFYRAVVDAYKARTQQKGADPLATLGSDAPAWAPTNDRANSSGSTQPQASSGRVPPAPLAPAPWNNAAPIAQPLASANGSTVAPAGGVQPASFAAPLDSAKSADPIATQSPAPGTTAAPPAAGAPDSCSVQFRHIEKRLRELGATYYLLETWGPSGDRYRFYCTVALAGEGDSGHNRVFQAMDADPLQAMTNVLAQVEAFRAPATPFSFSGGTQR